MAIAPHQPPAAPPSPQVAYAAVAGSVDHSLVQRVIHGISGAMASGTTEIHLMLQSGGGTVGDGIALYNFLRALPIDLHLYNSGNVSSIAVIAYLGAKHRLVSASGAFMVHNTYAGAGHVAGNIATAQKLRAVAASLENDDRRTEAILRAHPNLSPGRLARYRNQERPFDAKAALACGLATRIAEFTVPLGNKVFTV